MVSLLVAPAFLFQSGRRPAFRANFRLGMAFRPRLASRGASLPSITPDNHPFSDLRNCEGYFSGTPFTSELLNLTQERKHVQLCVLWCREDDPDIPLRCLLCHFVAFQSPEVCHEDVDLAMDLCDLRGGAR